MGHRLRPERPRATHRGCPDPRSRRTDGHSGREALRRAAHQRLAPVGRCAGDMRDAARSQPRDMIVVAPRPALESTSEPAMKRAQKDLHAAIAADVVESAPDRRRTPRGAFGDDRAGEAFERVADDLRHAGRARGQHQPFGGALGLRGPRRRHRQARGHHQRNVLVGPSLRLIGDDGIDVGIVDQCFQMVGIEVGRAQQHAPREPVDLDHGEAGQQLARHRQQHRPSRQLAAASSRGRSATGCPSARRVCRASEMLRPFSSGLR